MKLSTADIQKIANLARLEFNAADLETFSTQLSSILTHVEALNTLKTDGIEPTAHIEAVATPFREDKAVHNPVSKDILSQSPDHDGPLFKVPKVL